MKETFLFNHISELVAEEVVLRQRQTSPLWDSRRLRRLESEVGECWGRLREDRSRRGRAGDDGGPPRR